MAQDTSLDRDRPDPPTGCEIIEGGKVSDKDFVWNSDGYWERYDSLAEEYRAAMGTRDVAAFHFVARPQEIGAA